MGTNLLTLYFIPGLLFVAVILLVQLLLREYSVSTKMRRAFLSVTFAIFLSPVIVPAGTIFTALVPNGLLVLMGSLPMLHSTKLAIFALASFILSGAVGYALSFFIVRPSLDVQRHPSGKKTLITAILLTAGIPLVLFYGLIPDRRIEAHIDWNLIESLYGEQFEAIAALSKMSSAEDFHSEIDRLEAMFSEDPLVASLTISSGRNREFLGSAQIDLVPRFTVGSCRSYGTISWHQERMMRCTRGNQETLKYERGSTSLDGDEGSSISIEFDYLQLLETYSSQEAVLVTLISDEINDFNDQRIMGEWLIRHRFRNTVTDHVEQVGVMIVGPRAETGEYQLEAQIEAHFTLREGKSDTSSACEGTNSCIQTTTATGHIEIVRNRVLLVFDNSFWMSDRLDLEGDVMIGRDDWGSVTVYERAD